MLRSYTESACAALVIISRSPATLKQNSHLSSQSVQHTTPIANTNSRKTTTIIIIISCKLVHIFKTLINYNVVTPKESTIIVDFVDDCIDTGSHIQFASLFESDFTCDEIPTESCEWSSRSDEEGRSGSRSRGWAASVSVRTKAYHSRCHSTPSFV
jgi:hypothetical protein